MVFVLNTSIITADRLTDGRFLFDRGFHNWRSASAESNRRTHIARRPRNSCDLFNADDIIHSHTHPYTCIDKLVTARPQNMLMKHNNIGKTTSWTYIRAIFILWSIPFHFSITLVTANTLRTPGGHWPTHYTHTTAAMSKKLKTGMKLLKLFFSALYVCFHKSCCP